MTILNTRPSRPLSTALGIASLLLLAACGQADTGATTTEAVPTETAPSETAPSETAPSETAPSETAPSETESSETAPSETPEPELIPYAGGESRGFEVQDRDDADTMTGAPPAFKRFIGRTAQEIADGSTCTDGYVGVTVEMLRTDGYASGGVNDCGGYRALWAVVDGHWKEVAGSQEMWDCAVLERYTVPSDVAGDACYDYDAQQERSYQQS